MKSKLRQVILFFFFLMETSVLLGQNDSLLLSRVQIASQDIRMRYAPDRRIKQWVLEPSMENNKLLLRGYTTEADAKTAFLQAISDVSVEKVDQIELLPSAQLGDKLYGLATVSVSNNRYEPRQAAEMATQMMMGMPLEILKKQGGYYLVRTPDQYIAWTEDLMIALKTRAELTEWNKSDRVVVTEIFAHVYEGPDPASGMVSDLVAGNILKRTGEKKGYYAVEFPDGRKGFIPKASAIAYGQWLSSRKPTVNNVESTARLMMGTPYLWGGTSMKGVDCSGFIKTSYFLQGMILPRDASQQAGIGEKVDIFEQDTVSMDKAFKNLQRGDLLFFSSLKDGKPTGRITHVAMYLTDGNFIHASGLVRINNMKRGNNAYGDWETRAFVAARRITANITQPGVVPVSKHPLYNQ